MELYQYKQNHSDLDWESEIMRRTELLSHKIDLERLRIMAGESGNLKSKSNIDNVGTKKGSIKSNQIGAKKRGMVINDDEDEDGEQGEDDEGADFDKDDDDDDDFANVVADDDEDEEEENDDDDDDDNDDDDSNLFDSDEEEEITKRVQQNSSNKVPLCNIYFVTCRLFNVI